ncbi:MAG: hypothetical protein V4714_22650 [Bacteroidota bacterium]
MKNSLLSLLFFVCFASALAQPTIDQADWHQGSLVLRSGLELNGEIYFDQVTKVVLFKSQQMIKAFSSHQVQSFKFLEQSFGILREFVAYDFNQHSHYPRKEFLEVILKGPLTLLRRHRDLPEIGVNLNTQRVDGQPDTFDYSTGFSYFVLIQNQFVALKKFRKEILPLISKDFSQEISQLIKEKSLHTFALDHQIKLINHYNFLKRLQMNSTFTNQEVAIHP